MFFHLSATKLIDLGDQPVQKLTVMAHDDSRAVKGIDGLFQHIF